MKKVVTIVMVAALVGCASLHQSLETDITRPWIGAPVDELLGRWGLPKDERIVAGQHVLVWPVENHCNRAAAVDPDRNIVVSVSITGEYCPVMKIDPGSAYYLWRRL